MSKEVEERSEEIGSMCIILHRERSFHDIDTRVLKSAVQKYARRGMCSPKGVWCLIELDLFSSLEIKPHIYPRCQLTHKQIQMNAVRMRSNMINRLVAIMSEDVGPCNPQLPSKIHQLYLQWIQTRRDSSGRKILIEMYHCLANETIRRIRLLSDLRTVYNLPEYLTDNKHLHRQLLEKFQMTDLIHIMYDGECRGKTKQQLYELIIEHLGKKSELAFAYLSVLFQRNDQTWINQQLWPHLIRTSPFRESTQALAFFYKTLKHKEHYLYLYHAMAFVIYEDKIRKIDEQKVDQMNIDVDKLYEDHLNKETVVELDSFVFDRHTGVATSRSDFALHGALVTNECKDLLIEKYRQMYNEFKIIMDNEEQEKKQTKKVKRKSPNQEQNSTKKKPRLTTEEKTTNVELDTEIVRLGYHLDIKPASFVHDELSNLAHGQRRTSAHKKAFTGDAKRLFYNLYFTRALLALEQHLQIPDHLRSIVDWHSIIKIENTNEYYLQQKALGKLSTSEKDQEIVTTKIETNVKVLRRGSHVHRLNELEKDQSNFSDDDQQVFRATIQHFYLRYILNIGDSGTWNILVRRDGIKGICGIDFEEIRSEKGKKSSDPLSLIMSKVSKQQRDLYGSYTNQITIFQSQIDLSNELAKTLSTSFKIDVDKMNERIEEYANSIVKKN